MKSTFGGLNTITRGLYAQQAALDTVGHNVANANTDGYSRQSVNLSTTRPENVYGANGENQAGTGVNVQSITRARDTFMDRQMWKENSSLGYGQIVQDTLGRVEGVFHEPSETGVQTTLNRFWNSWQTLATNASDDGMRTAVRQRGVELTDAIAHATQQLTDMVADTNSVVDIKVNNLNQMSAEIYSLNRQIVTIETGGLDHANDLRDRRDTLVDQMSKIINVNVSEDKYGNFNIQSANVPLVDGAGFQKLATISANDPDYGYEIHNVVVEGGNQPLNFKNGELYGLLQVRDSVSNVDSADGIKGYIKKLDTISQFLLQDFNDVHKNGLGKDNSTGHNFFGNEGTDYNPKPPAAPFTLPPNTMGWIDQLKVNPVLFNPSNGLDMIAAKTAVNNLTIQQSNSAGGTGKIASSYAGITTLNYKVKIGSTPIPPAVRPAGELSAAGDVNAISVSINNGINWKTAIEAVPSTIPKTFVLPMPIGTPTTQAVTIQIASDSHNAIDDSYTFSVNQGNAAGNNAVKLANSMKIDTSPTLGGSSLDTYYSSVIGTLGVQTQSAQRLTDNQKTLVGQIDNWRQSVSGVNVDEEMTNMIRFQKGYAAAARVITTMDEMLDKLINSTGMVGR